MNLLGIGKLKNKVLSYFLNYIDENELLFTKNYLYK
jgi:hypothetical protein